MKTRIIQTRFFDDELNEKVDVFGQHLYLYLLCCKHINICGIFQLREGNIKYESKLNDKQFEIAKSDLEKNKKVFMNDGWVYVVNARKNNNYEKSELNQIACQKELSRVPTEIMSYFNSSIDTTINSTPIVLSIVPINNKPKVINQKPQINNSKEAQEIIDVYNLTYSKKLEKAVGFEDNLQYWLTIYSLEDIKNALINYKQDDFWKDTMTPEILLRKKNPRGEKVDRIAEKKDIKFKPKPMEPIYTPPLIKIMSDEEREKGRAAIEKVRKNLSGKFNMPGGENEKRS